MDKTYSFRRSYGRSDHTFYISETDIHIVGRCPGGGGRLELSDLENMVQVANAATVRDVFTMRTRGLVEMADRIRQIQKRKDHVKGHSIVHPK